MISLDLAIAIGICGVVALGVTPWRDVRKFNQRAYKNTKPQQLLQYIEYNKSNQLALDNKPYQNKPTDNKSLESDAILKPVHSTPNNNPSTVFDISDDSENNSSMNTTLLEHNNTVPSNEIITPPSIPSNINSLHHSEISSISDGSLRRLNPRLPRNSNSNKFKFILSILTLPMVLDLFKMLSRFWKLKTRYPENSKVEKIQSHHW
eukprot:gb/GECH01013727.1/.p1 GENE.gb/GECH01013727.1/~~gb/GECH01013727.1/.p1  ORF type:complete len:206 (+),score=43.28 gb/GECH01013727.1/:1-618(+)